MKLDLLVADHIDTLKSGKPIALGVYADGVVVLDSGPDIPEPSDAQPWAVSLSFLLSVAGLPSGAHELQISLLNPAGVPITDPDRPPLLIRVAEGQSAIVIVPNTQPLACTMMGEHKFKVSVGDVVRERTFEIRRRVVGAS